MQFGVMLYTEPRVEALRSFEALVEEAQALEAAGFDYCVMTEHHQGTLGELSEPLVWMAGLAARTSRLRLGLTAVVLPLHHPIRLAEELATLDVISSGRLFIATGLGYQEKDFRAIGIPMDERLSRYRETLQILRSAWESDYVTFRGRHYHLDDVRVSPRPIQPRLEIWGGAMTERAVARVGRESDAWFALSMLPPGQLAPFIDTYEKSARAAGRKPRVFLNRNGWIADSFAEARAVYEEAMIRHSQTLDGYAGSRAVVGQVVTGLPDRPLGDHQFVLGSPEECIPQIKAYLERFPIIEGISLRLRLPFGPDHESTLRAIERFGREVLPVFKKE